MNILLGTDGSSYAREAASFLNHLLHPELPAHVDLVAVVPGTPGEDSAGNRSDGSNGHHARLAGAANPAGPEDWIAEARAELVGSQITVEENVLPGDPSEVLVDRARSGRYDLVAVGVKGCGATPFFELGRVARSLLQAPAPSTLLVRKGGGGYSRSSGETAGPRKIRPLIAASRDQQPDGAEWSSLSSLALVQDEMPVIDLAGRNGYQPIREIDRQARKTEADLVILSAHSRIGPEGTSPRGAVRTTVWTAPCSVLLLRTATPARMNADLPIGAPEQLTPRTRSRRDKEILS